MIFLAFINDLPDCAESVDMLFADDSKAARKAPECHRTKIDLDNIRVWSEANGMFLSLDKSACLYYGYNNNRHQYHITE